MGRRVALMFLLACAMGCDDLIARSHVDENVPPSAEFARLLRRDLTEYFSRERSRAAFVAYELLRDGPTQSGAAYPKYYAWVVIDGGKTGDDRGAVRLAAIERTHFEVIDFVSEHAIEQQSDILARTFPRPVIERIDARRSSRAR